MSIGRYRSICMRGSCELSAKSGEIVFGKVVAMAAGLSHGSVTLGETYRIVKIVVRRDGDCIPDRPAEATAGDGFGFVV